MEGSEKPNLAPQGKLEDELLKLKQKEKDLKAKIDELSVTRQKIESVRQVELDKLEKDDLSEHDLFSGAGDVDAKYHELMKDVNEQIADASFELGLVGGEISKILELKKVIEEGILGDKSLDGMTPS